MKKALSSILVNATLVALPFLLLEGAFRLLPVAYLPPILPVTAEAPVARFQPNVEYPWSRDWNFSIVTRKRSNNYGFIHVSDYRPEERTPLLAVIGDSLVEAQQVDAGKSVAELLDAALAGKGRVYSLAMSGAPLSQYLVYAQYARQTFGAQAMAIVVAPNDFDESLLKYRAEHRFHEFAEDGTLQRLDYELSGAKKILRESAALRFIMYNLEAAQRLGGLLQSLRGNARAAVLSGEALERRIADSNRAVKHFFDQLPGSAGLGPESIVFVLDHMRPEIYSAATAAQAESGFYGRMRRDFMQEAAAHGYQVIDLEPMYLRAHKLGRTIEVAPNDRHWSELGHRMVAHELAQSAVFRRVFSTHQVTPWNTP